MNAYSRLRSRYRPRRNPLITFVGIIISGWVGIALGFLILYLIGRFH